MAHALQTLVVAVPVVLVKHIMSEPAVTFFAEQTLPLAEDVMRFKHLRHLPVIDDDSRLVGLLTHRDILAAQISTLSGLTEAQRRARQEDVTVRQVMTRDIWTVSPDALASGAGRTLLDHTYGCLPVVDDDHRLVGIVTERDYLRFAIKTLQLHDGVPVDAAPEYQTELIRLTRRAA
jgi:CBS domain-containing membrane protein